MTKTDARMAQASGLDRGRNAEWPSDIPARGWKEIGLRVYQEVMADRVMLVAGGVTFYLLLAIFPALTAFVSLFGLFADPASISQQMEMLSGVLPEGGMALMQDQLVSLAAQEGGALTVGFVVSLAIAFWTANNGIKAIFEALNIAYGEEEKRSFVRLVVVTSTFTLGAMLVAALMIVAVGVVPALLAVLNLEGASQWVLRLVRWPILLVVIAAGLATLYRYGPSRAKAQWRWVTWGGAIATLVWLVGSIAFTTYLENFADYNATYGSLGALMGFLLWIWISMTIVIVGAEINAEMEHQTARDTTGRPEREIGARGAYMADHVAGPAD